MRRYLLDTNHVSYIVRRTSAAARERFLQFAPAGLICVSAITEAELRYGLAKRPEATMLRRMVEEFFGMAEVLSWRHEEALIYGELRASQEAAGKKLEALDMLIAAHAMATGSVLVSADKAFGHILPSERVENWVTDLN